VAKDEPTGTVASEALKQGFRLAVLERAVVALIATHPDKTAFETRFRTDTALFQTEHTLVTAQLPPPLRDFLREEFAVYPQSLLAAAGLRHDEEG